ncbi:amino acid permease [Hyphobacterium sp. HN65]|uniref:Arginine/agmatine antiporter n=1 Tax=Hyphobacterium lacteum TaxID=3116575 RepID=A0ABU7LNQ3_9PROT|nr:amino acid permease [Hyphobacterium sp. HN65]MEE2525544.1 amino acid permease [Hyphobacterium sp. HN65]
MTAETEAGLPPVPNPAMKPLGFWGCWSLTVGVMIGSGIFLLPTVLAPYGLMSFGGWLLTGGSSILLALVLARLAGRTTRTGGPYAYAHDAFGDLPGFLIAWGYWASVWIATPTVALAFVGYLGVFFPALNDNPMTQLAIALALLWGLTLVSIRGVREAGFVQLLMTFLKLIPLILIIFAGLAFGSAENLPAFNPSEGSFISVLATTALLTMWAFAGMEAGVIPAGEVENPQKTMPRAIITGVITVTIVYIASTAAVMMLVPADQLAASTSPFSQAARVLGTWGPPLVAIGALISTAGSLNGNIFTSGQMPLAVALDRLAPKFLAIRNKGHAPYWSLILASSFSSVLLLANFSRGLVGAFTFLLMMSTLTTLIPMLVSAMAEFKHSWRSARGWAAIAVLGALYSIFAILGSGLVVLAWGAVLLAVGVVVFYVGRQRG